jgi:hypothetical protein
MVSGTYGLTGAADTILVLDRKRETDNAILKVTGRDVEEESYPLKFKKENCNWELTDEIIDQSQLNEMSRMIVDLITLNNGLMESKEIVSKLKEKDFKESTVRWKLSDFVKKEILSKGGRGVYILNNKPNKPNNLNNINNTNKPNIPNNTNNQLLNNIGLLEEGPINKNQEMVNKPKENKFIGNIGIIGNINNSPIISSSSTSEEIDTNNYLLKDEELSDTVTCFNCSNFDLINESCNLEISMLDKNTASSCSAFQIRTCKTCERFNGKECEFAYVEKQETDICDYRPDDSNVMNI